MSVYMVTIAVVSTFSLLYDYLNEDLLRRIYNPKAQQLLKQTFFFAILVVLISVAGLREFVGRDYLAYVTNYPIYVDDIWNSIMTFNEPGIRIIAYLSSIIHDHYGTMMLISSVLTVGLSVYTIGQHSKLFFFSIMLYILIGSWHESFNAVRQYIACAILFFGHVYILQRQLVKYSWIVFLASLFHISALPMIVFYFLPQKRLNFQQIILLLIIGIIGLYSYTFFFDIFAQIASLRGEQFIINQYVIEQLHIYRILVTMAPLGLYLYLTNHSVLTEKDYFYINMLFVNALIFIVSANSAYLARYTIYTNIYTVLALPSILKGQDKLLKWLIIIVTLLLYFIFWYVEVSGTDNLTNFQWLFDLK